MQVGLPRLPAVIRYPVSIVQGLLNRRRALEVLSAMLDGGAIPGCGPALESREGEEAETVSAGIQSLSGEERLRRVRSRLGSDPHKALPSYLMSFA